MKIKSLLFTAVLATAILCLSPAGAMAAGLSQTQISAIMSLLQSFGADSTAVANVQTSLTGGTPILTPGVPTCSTLYWLDNTDKTCQTQKQFCGSYMYYGLQTFTTQQECLNTAGASITISHLSVSTARPGDSVTIYGTNLFDANPVVLYLASNRNVSITTNAFVFGSNGTDALFNVPSNATPGDYRLTIWGKGSQVSSNELPITIISTQPGNLTHTQISAITSLLTSFGANSTTVANVQTVLYGGNPQYSANSLTNTQKSAIISLLQSFGASATIIANVQTVLTAATQPSITVTSPNGGETWTPGSTHTVTWTSSGAQSNYMVSLVGFLVPGGVHYSEMLYPNVPVSNGSYNLTVPTGLNPGTYKIGIHMIDSIRQEVASDQSDNYFNITAASNSCGISTNADFCQKCYANGGIVKPGEAGCWCASKNVYINAWYGSCLPPALPTATISVSPETVSAGQCATLTWSSTNATAASITGPTFGTSASNNGPVAVNGSKTICPTAASNYFTFFVHGPGGYAQSKTILSVGVAQSSLSVISPNGGEMWKVGETHNITWSAKNALPSAYVIISLNSMQGATSTTLISSTTNSGSYSWTIPSILQNITPLNGGNVYKVNVSVIDTTGKKLYDSSDNYFSITNDSTVCAQDMYTCPNGTSVRRTGPNCEFACPAVQGSCGTSNGMAFPTAPTTGLCTKGAASTVSGLGPWTWMCEGFSGGETAACSATKSTICAKDMYTCSNGTMVGRTGPNCEFVCPTVKGVCGSANGVGATSLTSSSPGLCSAGTVQYFAGPPWAWACMGVGSGNSVFCAAPLNGSCGTSNGKTSPIAPTANLCSTGTASVVSGSGPWTWSCTGSTGGLTASCSASKSATTCTSFTYSAWSTCTNNSQSRTVLTSYPSGCTGGTPILTQSCNSGIPPVLSITNITADTGYIYATYKNNGTTTDGKFIVEFSANGKKFATNYYYPFSIPAPGANATTGGVGFELIGLAKTVTANITATVVWQGTMPAGTASSTFSKTIRIPDDPPNLAITNITTDPNCIYVTYVNNGGTGTGVGSFEVKTSTSTRTFTTNYNYPYSVLAHGTSSRTGCITSGLLGLVPGSTATITASIVWDGTAPAGATTTPLTKTVSLPLTFANSPISSTASLSDSQIQSIISLLQSFGVTSVNEVFSILKGNR